MPSEAGYFLSSITLLQGFQICFTLSTLVPKKRRRKRKKEKS